VTGGLIETDIYCFLRAVTKPQPLHLLPPERRHHVWIPGAKRISRLDPTSMPGLPSTARFRINSQGLRGREFGPDTDYRILVMGGSTVECMYIDDENAWPAIVGAALPRTSEGRSAWIGAAGRSGMNSRDHVPQFKYLTAQYPRIDTVLLLVGINDVVVTLIRGDHYVLPPPVTDPEAEQRQITRAFMTWPGKLRDQARRGDPWYARTALYQFARRLRNAGTLSIGTSAYGQQYSAWRLNRKRAGRMLDDLPDLEAPLFEFQRNLEAIADLAVLRGIRLVLLTQPVLWRDDLSVEEQDLLWLGGVGKDFENTPGNPHYTVRALAEAMRRFNDATIDMASKRGLGCIDLGARIQRTPAMFLDDTHFTLMGCRAVASEVVENLRQWPPFV
jgi:hypothetical protein